MTFDRIGLGIIISFIVIFLSMASWFLLGSLAIDLICLVNRKYKRFYSLILKNDTYIGVWKQTALTIFAIIWILAIIFLAFYSIGSLFI